MCIRLVDFDRRPQRAKQDLIEGERSICRRGVSASGERLMEWKTDCEGTGSAMGIPRV